MTDDITPLEQVQRAAFELAEARDFRVELERTIRKAVKAGESVTAVAEAAGLSRPTVYAILKRS